MWSKSEGWVGISPTHLAMATVFRGSHQEVKEELFVPWNLKGNGVSQNEQPQNEILRSEGAWGRCPQQADGRKCERVFTFALLAGTIKASNRLLFTKGVRRGYAQRKAILA